MNAPDRPLAARPLTPGGLPAYRLPDSRLQMGPSIANPRCWVDTKGTGDIECLYSVEIGRVVCGTVAVRFAERAASGMMFDAPPQVKPPEGMRIPLDPDAPYELCIYEPNLGRWLGPVTGLGRQFSPLLLDIETGGYRLVRLRHG